MTDEDKVQMDQKSCMQKYKKVMCYKCGKKGHYANKCASGDSNDNESSTRSNSSLLSTTAATTAPGQTALDGVATGMMVSHYSKREA
jgi:hypothetical protein